MIDHELHGLQRIDAVRVPVERDNRVAHGGEIDHAGDAREVLQQDPRRHEGDFLLEICGGLPLGERSDVVGLDEGVVLTAQQVLQQDLHRVREARDSREAGLLECGQTVDPNRLSVDAKGGLGAEAVAGAHHVWTTRWMIEAGLLLWLVCPQAATVADKRRSYSAVEIGGSGHADRIRRYFGRSNRSAASGSLNVTLVRVRLTSARPSRETPA